LDTKFKDTSLSLPTANEADEFKEEQIRKLPALLSQLLSGVLVTYRQKCFHYKVIKI
jgi:hypothetical protein